MYGGDRQKLWTNVSVAKINYQDVKPISKLKKKTKAQISIETNVAKTQLEWEKIVMMCARDVFTWHQCTAALTKQINLQFDCGHERFVVCSQRI